MASVEQALVAHLLQRPPCRFHVVVVQGHVGVVEVDPVGHAFGHLTPRRFVGPHRFTAGLVEFCHSEGFNRFVAHEVESLLDFDFNGKTVGVPPALSFDEKPLHGFPATDEILERASDHVVDARFSIGRRRSFKKDERCVCSAPLDGSLEGLFGGPLLEERRFQVNRVQFSRRRRLSHVSPTKGAVLNTTPHFVHFS